MLSDDELRAAEALAESVRRHWISDLWSALRTLCREYRIAGVVATKPVAQRELADAIRATVRAIEATGMHEAPRE